MFHVKPLNKLPTTCILNWGPCFCMVQCIRDSSFVQNVVYIACVHRMVIKIFERELTNHYFLNIPAFESATLMFNALISKVCNAHQTAGISSKKITLRTSTIASSRFAAKAFKESASGSAFIFLRWFKLAHICRPIQVTGPHKGDKQANQST